MGIEPVALHTLNTPELTRRLIADVSSPNLRVILDTANLVTPETAAPEAQMEILERALSCFGKQICVLHVKDGVFNGEGKWENRLLGQGVMDWPRLLPRLREHNDTLCALREGVYGEGRMPNHAPLARRISGLSISSASFSICLIPRISG